MPIWLNAGREFMNDCSMPTSSVSLLIWNLGTVLDMLAPFFFTISSFDLFWQTQIGEHQQSNKHDSGGDRQQHQDGVAGSRGAACWAPIHPPRAQWISQSRHSGETRCQRHRRKGQFDSEIHRNDRSRTGRSSGNHCFVAVVRYCRLCQ